MTRTKQLCLLISLLYYLPSLYSSPLHSRENIPKNSDIEIADRIAYSREYIDAEYNEKVKHFIDFYTINKRNRAEIVLGRAVIYFPLIEKYIRKYRLPDELKYLPTLESTLNPTAVSKAGAAGLWQLMPATAKAYGLVVNDIVDERFDPHKSTEAALLYLRDLHRRFGDWSLALAAYNCGPTRLRKKIKKANTKDFWKLSSSLPKQTQKYVPHFIAVSYLMNYYQFHDLNPEYPDYSFQFTTSTKVFHQISFKQIAKEAGISLELIKTLNPSYKRGVIPDSKEGNFLILPDFAISDFNKNHFEKVRQLLLPD